MMKYVPPMSKREYDALPEIVRLFVTWNDVQQGKMIEVPNDEQLKEAVEYFTKGAKHV